MDWKSGDLCMAHGHVFRVDGFEDMELDGTVHRMAAAFSFDSEQTLKVPVGSLVRLPPRDLLETRRTRLVAPVEGRVERNLDARNAELHASAGDADRCIDALRRLLASGAAVDNSHEQIFFRKLLPYTVTPVALGLGEEPAPLAAEAGIGFPRRPHWTVAWWKA